MKNIEKFVLGVLTLLMTFSCADEDLAPIITFDSATKGAYVRLIEGGDLLVNLLDVAGSSYSYTVEFVDLEKGALVSEYLLALEYDDNDATNGDNSTTIESFRSYSTSDFAVNENGFVGLANITISANDLFAAVGIGDADVSPGDNFNISGRLIMNDGSERNGSESSSAVNGAAFRGHFDFTMPASCPSAIEGTYAVSTELWCGGTVETTVDLINEGAGVYSFSDWSFGAYPECYGGFCCAQGDFAFTDVCTVVTISDGEDSFGDSWRFSSSISGNDLIITWENYTYADGLENGVSTITFPDGIPFTLD